jgi:hypothetical protein
MTELSIRISGVQFDDWDFEEQTDEAAPLGGLRGAGFRTIARDSRSPSG